PGEGFAEITALSVDPAGDLYVLDGKGRSVHVFDRLGKPVAAFSVAGPGEDVAPSAMAVDRIGRIYVADRRSGRVLRFRWARPRGGCWWSFSPAWRAAPHAAASPPPPRRSRPATRSLPRSPRASV